MVAGTEEPGKAEGPSESRGGRHSSRHPLAESGAQKANGRPHLHPGDRDELRIQTSYRGVQSFTGGCACPTAVFNDGE